MSVPTPSAIILAVTNRGWRAVLSPRPDGGRSPLTTLVLVLLLVNALPAFVVLESVPGRTEHWFVWTIHPDANARVLAVMYGNAFLLALMAWFARDWGSMRVTMVVAAPFSVAATIVTFLTLDPFLKHPWYDLAYWLLNYLVLCIAAPVDLVVNERIRGGGRLTVTTPLGSIARAAAAVLAAGLAFYSVSLLLELSTVSSLWPFEITPLVSRIVGVWLGALALAHVWVAWDGDRLRARPLVVAMACTGALLAAVPLLHRGDVRSSAAALTAYLTLAAAMIVFPGLSVGRRAKAETLAVT